MQLYFVLGLLTASMVNANAFDVTWEKIPTNDFNVQNALYYLGQQYVKENPKVIFRCKVTETYRATVDGVTWVQVFYEIFKRRRGRVRVAFHCNATVSQTSHQTVSKSQPLGRGGCRKPKHCVSADAFNVTWVSISTNHPNVQSAFDYLKQLDEEEYPKRKYRTKTTEAYRAANIYGVRWVRVIYQILKKHHGNHVVYANCNATVSQESNLTANGHWSLVQGCIRQPHCVVADAFKITWVPIPETDSNVQSAFHYLQQLHEKDHRLIRSPDPKDYHIMKITDAYRATHIQGVIWINLMYEILEKRFGNVQVVANCNATVSQVAYQANNGKWKLKQGVKQLPICATYDYDIRDVDTFEN